MDEKQKDRLEKEHMTYLKMESQPSLTVFHNSIYFCYVKRIKTLI